MSKNKNKPTPAQEYLARLEWDSQRRRGRYPSLTDPVEPQWKDRLDHP